MLTGAIYIARPPRSPLHFSNPAFREMLPVSLYLAEGVLLCAPPGHEYQRTHWCLRLLGEQHRLPALSMGMSHDFEVAIEEGATHIRVGTALFGRRKKP